MRRGAMNPFFSKASVRKLEPVIRRGVDNLVARIHGFKGTRQPLAISLAYVAFSSG
jgi:cytochrome P450